MSEKPIGSMSFDIDPDAGLDGSGQPKRLRGMGRQARIDHDEEQARRAGTTISVPWYIATRIGLDKNGECPPDYKKHNRKPPKMVMTRKREALLLAQAKAAKAAKSQSGPASSTEAIAAMATAPEAPKTRQGQTHVNTGTMSGIEAAAKVLAEAGKSLTCPEMVDIARAAGYWCPGGATPAATLYVAILRDNAKRGTSARFLKDGKAWKLKGGA